MLDAAFLAPGSDATDGIDGYDKVPAKGQALMPNVGAGGGPTVSLVGLSRGPNIAGVTANLVNALNVNNGTLPGVYGDLGIFYSTAPETALGTYSGGTITNNSGDIVGTHTYLGTPLNLWDAWQMAGYGIKGTTNPLWPTAPLLDSNGRGNTGWGLANAVAGPQSGYAWEFDFAKYRLCDPAPYAPSTACLDQATQDVGPWNRIRYPGSQIAYDVPGDTTAGMFNGGLDANGVGFALSPATPLPATVSQSDGVSPNAIRWAYGQLTYLAPEFVWVKVKVLDPTELSGASGCPRFHLDTFGGDAGGDSNGKDHIWRYYDPNSVEWDGCMAIGKPATREAVKVGDTFQYNVSLYNLGLTQMSGVVVTDQLPSGVQFLSAVPAQNSGPNPLRWNVGTLQPGQRFLATVTVKATGTGLLTNTVCADGLDPLGNPVQSCADEKTPSGNNLPILVMAKEVSSAVAVPGASVTYTLRINNVGNGPTSAPVTITDVLPDYFTYQSLVSVTENGANVTGATTVNASDPAAPLFTLPLAIQDGKTARVVFTALIDPAAPAGSGYCNSFNAFFNGIHQSVGALACVDVGAGTIGDTVFRDWNGNGVQDAGDEGMPGVTITLYSGPCPPAGAPLATTTTNASGSYQFTGLSAGDYCVDASDPGSGGVPGAYTLTTGNDQTTVTLAQNEKRLDLDYGYLPAGAGSIGDKVFDDNNDDGLFDGSDVGVPNVTVNLYEDTNGNGVLDLGDLLIATQVTDGTGNYLFTGLATGISYVVDVDQSDPDIAAYFVATYGSSAGVVQTTSDPHAVSALSGSYLAADFGFYKTVPGSIGDDVFVDANGNGVRDAGEAGLPNVTVSLYTDVNCNGVIDPGEPLRATTSTDANGNYSFGNLPAGCYVVDVDQSDPDVPSVLLPTRDPIATTLTAGQNRTDVDFPFVTALTKSVDKTYDDPNVAPNLLTYTIRPRYPSSNLLDAAEVTDLIPAGTTFVNNPPTSPNAGGQPLDDTDPPDGIIDSVLWDLGSNAHATTGFKGGTAPAACQTTVTVVANSDTWIEQANPANNHGTDNKIRTTNAANDNVGLLHFNIGTATIPAGAVFNSVALHLTPSAGAGTNRQIEIHNLSTSFAEGAQGNAACTVGAAWQGPNCTDDWLSAGGDFGASDYSATNLATFDPTANNTTISQTSANLNTVVSGWLAGGINRGLAMIPVGSATNNVDWYPRTAGTAAYQPQLVLTYTENGCSGTTVIQDTGANEVPDTYIQEDSATSNFGTVNRLRVRPQATRHKHSLIKFNLSGVPAAATVSNATMRVEVQTNKSNDVEEIHRMVTAWTEGTGATNGATWNDPNGTGTAGVWASGAFSSTDYGPTVYGTITPSSKGGRSAVITPLVTGWINGTYPNNGIVMLSTGTSTADALYYSSEEGTASRRPSLTIDWEIDPVATTGTNIIRTGWTMAQNGDSFPVTMTLTDTSGVSTAGVAPSTVTVLGTNGANATCGSPTPASTTVPGNGSATFTWTCTITSVGSSAGSVRFRASASNGTTTWSASTSNSVIVSPVLQFQVTINTPASVNVVDNTAALYDGATFLAASNTVETALTATIGDRVWVDLDADGVQDAGEAGLAGVRVFLDANGNGVYDVGETYDVTDANGNYLFTGLALGTYTVVMDQSTLPAGYNSTTPPTLTRTISSAGQQITDADFGVVQVPPAAAGSIGDTVWIDADEDGLLSPGESGIPGVTVRLYRDVNNDGVVDAGDFIVATDVTDASGNYLFSGLPAGDYLVAVDENSTITTPFGVSTTIAAAMDLVSGTNPRDVTLLAGQNVTNADFGYNWGGSIGDFAWYDKNGNGVQDGPSVGCDNADPLQECGAADMTAVLVYDLNGNGIADFGEPIYAVAVSDANGFYLFDNLPPGNYVVTGSEQEVPAPASSANAGVIGTMVFSTESSYAVALSAGQDYLLADFGLIEAGRVEGNVFYDPNANQVFDGGESGFAAVQVALTGTDVNGNPVSLTTTTGADGSYSFVVPPGDYTVTYDTGSPAIPAGINQPTTATSYSFSVAAGEELAGFDFGLDNNGAIGDRVWNDADGDGIQDASENGIGGLTVLLWLDPNGDGNLADATLVDAQVTDSNGNYLFTGLADNSGAERYVVQVVSATVPSGFSQTGDPDEAGTCTTCDGQSIVQISGGSTVLTADFGYYAAGSHTISGTVFNDDGSGGGTAGNGTQDGTESGLGAGITVTAAVDEDGDGIVDFTVTTTTDASGNYTFEGIPDGSTVVITIDESTLPLGAWDRTDDTDGGNDATITLANVTGDVTDQDFGYVQNPGSIAGTVCLGDGDGQCSGETAAAGVTVTLTWAGPDGILGTADDVVATVVTDANGDYLFDASTISAANCSVAPCPLDDGLPAGLYSVVETNPANVQSLADADAGNPDVITVTLAAGANVTGQDFEDASTLEPTIGVAKAVSDGPYDNGDGTFTFTYSITVSNPSVVALTNVQVTDNLSAVFALAGGFTVDSKTSADLTVNPSYDGQSDVNLLSGTDSLAPLTGTGTILVTVTVTPGTNYGPYLNTAVATGTPPTGPAVTDFSDSGTNPDPQDSNAGAPGDSGGTDDPTPVTFLPSRIGVSKAVGDGPYDNGDGTFTLTYQINVVNAGTTTLTSLQVEDDLTATFAGAVGFTVDSVTSADLTVNPGYDGTSDLLLLAGVDTLAPGDSGAVSVVVTVEPGANLGPYFNTAVASAQPPTGPRISDDSDSGTNANPDNANPGAPGDTGGTDDPTPVLLEASRIGVSKGVASGPFDNGDGTYTLTYQINVMNAGTTFLTALQVTEDLTATFAGSGGFVVDAVSSADFTVNGGFDGSAVTDLLSGGDSLAAGATGTILVTATVTASGNYGPYYDTAVASAQPPTGPRISDDSDSGFNANPDNANPGQPGDTGGTDDPTPVTLEASRIGVAKNVSTGPADNGDGTFTLTYGIYVTNAGVTTLSDVQVVENLDATFAGSGGYVVDVVASAVLTVNPGFDGSADTALLAPGNVLGAGQTASIFVTVTVTPGSNYGPYLNSVVASAQPPTGPPISDTSDSGANAGPDNANPGEPGDTGGTDDPTPVTFDVSRLGVSKAVANGPTDNGDGTWTLAYLINVQNAGVTTLSDVQLDEDLASTFAGSGGFVVNGVSSPLLTVNPGFDGAADTNLLAAGNSLLAGQTAAVLLSVTVDPGGNPGPYFNVVIGTAQPPTGPPISDLSDSGLNADPNDANAGEPGDTGGTDDPTPVAFAACDSVVCDDGIACTVDACNPSTGECEYTPDDSSCDDGAYCNGVETCDATLGCLGGTRVSCNDGVACTVDACDEGIDSCVFTPTDSRCDDGLWCDGVETCDAVLGCLAGVPVDCDDGNVCTADTCDEDYDECAYENLCCGDGILQPNEDCELSGGEVCGNMLDDDLNGLTDCADAACEFGGCSAQCKFTTACQCISKDPQTMQTTRVPGRYKFHGRVVGSLPEADPERAFKFMVANNGDTIYTAELPRGSFGHRGKHYTYRDRTAKTGVDPVGPHAGLAFARVRLRTYDGVEYATVKVKIYADFSQVTDSCITTQFQVGTEYGILRTDWNSTSKGWRLYTRDYTCTEYNMCLSDLP